MSKKISNTKIKYNYWIYLLTCLFMMGIAIKISGRDPGTEWDVAGIIFRLAQMFFFATIAWFIGKKYKLHYSLVCGLCILVMVASQYLWEICAMLFRFSFDFEVFFGTIFLSIFSILLLGGAIFVISYPFQLLYSKICERFIKLK